MNLSRNPKNLFSFVSAVQVANNKGNEYNETNIHNMRLRDHLSNNRAGH